MLKKFRNILLIFIGIVFLILFINMDNLNRKYIYPIKYQQYVEKYSSENNMDKYLIYAIIKTESGFNSSAVSDSGARGLMQLMDETFDWVKYRMNDDSDISYNDMYDPENNIKYGTYLIMLLNDEYGNMRTAVAAYHTGRGNVNKWLKDEKYSSDGKSIDCYPSETTEYYVEKVMTAYKSYKNLYSDN